MMPLAHKNILVVGLGITGGRASFDMYSDYAHRGDVYCQAVDRFKNKFLDHGKNQNRT